MTTRKVLPAWIVKLAKPEMLSISIAALSLLVSMATLVYAITKIEYDVRPIVYLGVGDAQSYPGYYGLLVRNNGMGPAKIEKVVFHFDRQLIDSGNRVGDTITRMAYGSQPIDFVISSAVVDRGAVIGTGQEITIFAAPKEKLDHLSRFDDVLKRINVYVEYSSIGNQQYSATYQPYQ